MGAAALLSGAYDVPAAAAGFAGVTALAIAELIKHNRGYCRARELFVLPRLVFVRDYGACTRLQRVRAATLLGGEYVVCAAAAGFAGVMALAIAEFSATEALAARAIRLLRRGLFSCCPAVPMRDRDARVQRRCSAGRVLCAQLPPDSQVGRRWQLLE